MQKIQNLLSVCMGCFRKVSKKAYATCAVITTGSIIIAVVSMARTDFGGSGKNKVVVEAKHVQNYTSSEDEEENAEVNQYFSVLNASIHNDDITISQTLEAIIINEAEAIIPRELNFSAAHSSEENIDNNAITEVDSASLGLAGNKLEFEVSKEDYEALLRIVEAEATSEDLIGRILVANVVFNRVRDGGFPDNVYDVIHQQHKGKYQFSPLSDGRYYSIQVSDLTIDAVDLALEGVDYSEGALFFAARAMANPANMKWFDTKLNYLFKHGVHEFFSYN